MRHLLLSAAAIVMIAGSAAAQPQPDQPRPHRTEAPARPDRSERPAYAAPQRAPVTRGPEFRTYGGSNPAAAQFSPRNRDYAAPARAYPQGYANPGRFTPQNGVRQQYPGADHHMVNGQARYRTPGQRGDFLTPGQRGDFRTPGQRGDFRTPGQTADWRAAAQRRDWRNGRALTPGQRGWTPGQRADGWWRGHRGFDGYQGRRDGFWFAPGYGYYQPDPRWYDYDWEIGVSVPYGLRSYYINDPYAYDLPPAPYGCAWIFLGNEMVLIDIRSGQIVQIAGEY